MASVEKRAWVMARLSTHNNDVALDIVQDAMLSMNERQEASSTENRTSDPNTRNQERAGNHASSTYDNTAPDRINTDMPNRSEQDDSSQGVGTHSGGRGSTSGGSSSGKRH